MHITFVCPGMPFNGDFVAKGKSLGGSETACYYVAREMAAMGHKVLVFTSQQDAGGKHDGVDYAWAGPQNERWPIGEYAHSFMSSTYVDALIVQRATAVHQTPHAAKTAFWWLHDLALMRAGGAARVDLFQYDGILAVSEWHRRQIADTWHLSQEGIHVVRNSVDLSLYDKLTWTPPADGDSNLRMLYQSRPERGIDYLLRPGGIMDQLQARRPGAKLYVCGYDNYPDHMKPYYEGVFNRCRQMQNVQVVGHMGKADLAKFQDTCDLMLYPSTFEETSCISAMEAQAAGLPLVGCQVGALPETCALGGSMLFPLVDGQPDIARFVDTIANVTPAALARAREAQLRVREDLGWRASAEALEKLIVDTLHDRKKNAFSTIRSMIDKSDVIMARKYYSAELHEPPADFAQSIAPEVVELVSQYTFDASMEEHYDAEDAVADVGRSGLDVTGNLRFQETSRMLMQDKPSNVLDYGCQKGHYLWSIASRAPKGVRYTGIDISPKIVDWARKNCTVNGTEIRFEAGDVMKDDFDYSKYGKFDALLLGEVLEHVVEPKKLMERMVPLLTDGSRIVVTTPYGDWEGKEYNDKPGAPRYHLHHFERADLSDMFGHNEGFMTSCVPAGRSAHEPLGSLVTTFVYRADREIAKDIDYARKYREFMPRQTMSFCAIVRNGELTMLRSLMSVREIADEFVIAIDKSTTDGTREVIAKFQQKYGGSRRFDVFDAESPLEIGFDEARNRTIARARGDWIMWMDSDEELVHQERMPRYLKGALFDGYGIAQHHMSGDPVGVLTTDWPVRFFRRNSYLRFSGVVHEHPDDVERPNNGPRCPAQLVDINILHHGYTTEEIRRKRFVRNLPLIRRDRKQNPNRSLGRMLWIRDQAHLCMFEIEQFGYPTAAAREYAMEGMRDWEALMEEAAGKPIVARMVRDGLEFYSTLVKVLGGGFDAAFQFHAARGAPANPNGGARKMGTFLNKEHLYAFMRFCVDEQTEAFDSKYF